MERMPQFVYAHYNLDSYEHTYYVGDLQTLFGSSGSALSPLLTNRFCVDEVIG